MDYEKKYKEALERAKELSKTTTGANYEYIFPELAESKGEKIRKILYGWVSAESDETFKEGFSKGEILAWLEKQGEQKPWKPTNEQIEAIRRARSFVVDDFGEHPTLSEILMELEEQLRKIKEDSGTFGVEEPIKVGDYVTNKNGTPFSNDQMIARVQRIESNEHKERRIWFEHGTFEYESKLRKVEI